MSTFSEDLDFFDSSVPDPLAQATTVIEATVVCGTTYEVEEQSSAPSSQSRKTIEDRKKVKKEEEEEEEEEEDRRKIFRERKKSLKGERRKSLKEDRRESVREERRKSLKGERKKSLKEEIKKSLTDEEMESQREEIVPSQQEEKEQSDSFWPEKEDIPENFSVDLWSVKESSDLKSPSSWDIPVGPIAWDDTEKPMERLLNYADLVLTEEEEEGVLTDRIVAACSSYLTESPGSKCHVAAKVVLKSKNLCDIQILSYHRFLQYIDLSWNNLKDLTPLGCVPYLMYLDVSHNLLQHVLRFKPPINLTYVNFSYNEVGQISDLTDFWSLSYLDLSHNKITRIQGLHNLRYLRHLDLSYNQIERLENLNSLRITDLNLEYNLISRFEMEEGLGVSTLPNLTNLYLNNNLITTLIFLKDVYHLKKLELQENNVTDLVELSYMKLLKNLRYLDMTGNPVSELKPYRSLLLNILQELRFLDQTEVDISERVAACKRKRFDVQLEAARNNARMILLEQLNDTSLNLDVQPIDQGPYPFVILVGPSASSKKYLVSTLGKRYSDKIYIGKLHTTRRVVGDEGAVLIETRREAFNDTIKAGKFLCVTENLGHLYGFSREELGKAVMKQKLCLTFMDMVGALTIHSYGIRPFLVLTIPESKEEHIQRLRMTYGPILYSIGASYLAQRQLFSNRQSNIKRMQTIVEDIIGRVISEEKVESDVDVPKVSLSDQPNTLYQSEEILTYYEDRKTSPTYGPYVCSPTGCGFQSACFPAQSCTFSSCVLKTKRFSASDVVMDDRVDSGTSYSIRQNFRDKIDLSSIEESEFGENDLFADWSMPFINWSEVHLDGSALEKKAEMLCENYIENVMSTRDVYQNLHLENPGLFSLVTFTDDTSKALKDIVTFLKEVWRSTPKRQPPFDIRKDPVYQEVVSRKLGTFKEMLQKDFLSADGDKSSRIFPEFAHKNSPSSICAEMELKGYGDYSDAL